MSEDMKDANMVFDILVSKIIRTKERKNFKEYLEEVLKPGAARLAYGLCDKNQTDAAKLLGWNRGTFRKYFEKSLESKRVPYGK